MSEVAAFVSDKLYELASAELFRYKGMLSVTRLIAINLKNGGDKESSALYEKQKTYMDEIDSIHSEYISLVKGLQNSALESVLFLKASIPSGGYPEFSQLFPVLKELRETIDKIIERNNYALDQASRLSLECLEKIKEIKKEKAYSSVFEANQDSSTGRIFDFAEK